MRKTAIIFTAILVCLLSAGILSVSANGPVFWRINSLAEIEKGDAQGISIADNGTMTLAPDLVEVFDTKQAFIWSAAADKAGNIYLGTGNEGRIFKVAPSGNGTLLYKTSELSVMALAVDERGFVYAGSSPDGRVYKISPTGEATVFYEPGTKYIWSMAFDRQGNLLLGTGDKGEIYRVSPSGQGALLVKTTQTNVTALELDGSGNIIAGTDPGGLVLRISPEGKAFTLFDSSLREIRDLAVGQNGAIYALALAESAASGSINTAQSSAADVPEPSISSEPDESITITISDLQVIDTPSTVSGTESTGSSSAGSRLKSAVYKIDPRGWSDPVWESKNGVGFAIALDDNSLKVGTSLKGRIYGISGGQKPMLLAQSKEAQTSRFIRSGGKLYAASSNLGRLYRLSAEASAAGTYTSSVRDAKMTSQWGRLSWIGEGNVEFQTRSGNTSKPDTTWSEWSGSIVNPEGEAISSPAARFIQWRAVLKGGSGVKSPSLREVTLSYLPRNVAPRIKTLTVLPAGVALQTLPQPQLDTSTDPLAGESGIQTQLVQIPPRKTFQRGAISIQWQAEDGNSDNIQYSIFYRTATGNEFYPLKSELRDNYYTIDPNALPDGRYVFKVTATDSLSNPENMALTDEVETEIVEIDNTPPEVLAGTPKLTSDMVEVIFRVTDLTSIIRRAEFQLDGSGWKSVYPADGIADSKSEEFNLTIKLPDRKPHIIAFRVFDANSNVGSSQVTIGQR